MAFPKFEGNYPKNVRKNARYSIKQGQGLNGQVVSLLYLSENGEKWHTATDEHPELVKMVNEVKNYKGQGPGGPFYINEYKQVIVPVGSAARTEYYLAGAYDVPLHFRFEENVISGEANDLEGRPLSPGCTWVGSQQGIRYKLCAGGEDIEYSISIRPRVTRDIKLSDEIGRTRAKRVAVESGILQVKGSAGGRFYVNEFLNVFAPREEENTTQYIYCGRIDLNEWFPKPHDH